MKGLVYGLLLALCLSSCSNDVADAPRAGQYLYADETITAAVTVSDEYPASITIYEAGKYVYQNLRNGNVVGTWPNYNYTFAAYDTFTGAVGLLVLSVQFSTSTTFTAVVGANESGVMLPASMVFKRDYSVLDINGDGILDSWQQL